MNGNGHKQYEFWAKAYLAAPFFNEEQLDRIKQLEDMCSEAGVAGISPRSFLVLKPRAPMEERRKVFFSNIRSIEDADIVLACTEWLDSGTSWEMGYAYAKGKRIVAYNWSQKPLNVMLAVGCDGVLQNEEELKRFVKGKQSGYATVEKEGKLWDFDCEVAKKWMQEIY